GERFGICPIEGYGGTELSPVAAVNISEAGRSVDDKSGKVGRPMPGVAVKIVDPDTFEPLAAGRQGLILVRGPNVMQGYLGRPDLTAQVLRDGWYVTGDIGTIDDDGFIELTDR